MQAGAVRSGAAQEHTLNAGGPTIRHKCFDHQSVPNNPHHAYPRNTEAHIHGKMMSTRLNPNAAPFVPSTSPQSAYTIEDDLSEVRRPAGARQDKRARDHNTGSIRAAGTLKGVDACIRVCIHQKYACQAPQSGQSGPEQQRVAGEPLATAPCFPAPPGEHLGRAWIPRRLCEPGRGRGALLQPACGHPHTKGGATRARR